MHHTHSLRSLLAYQGEAGGKREWPSTGRLATLTEYSVSKERKYTNIHENIPRYIANSKHDIKYIVRITST